MKVIDLLNMFENNNKIPIRIRVKHGVTWDYYKWDVNEQWYVTYDNSTLLRIACPKDLLEEVEYLNDEVEILEEEKKIPEKIDIWYSLKGTVNEEDMKEMITIMFEELKDKYNQLIDFLKSKGNE